jgi:hypothetical protein
MTSLSNHPDALNAIQKCFQKDNFKSTIFKAVQSQSVYAGTNVVDLLSGLSNELSKIQHDISTLQKHVNTTTSITTEIPSENAMPVPSQKPQHSPSRLHNLRITGISGPLESAKSTFIQIAREHLTTHIQEDEIVVRMIKHATW